MLRMRTYKIRIKYILLLLILPIFLLSCGGSRAVDTSPFSIPEGDIVLTFAVTADMREYTETGGFRDVCERIAWGGPGDFMISPGDIDPPGQVYNTIISCLGADYIWYPVVGNHESETPSDMTWLRSFNVGGNTLPGIVNTGPDGTVETTYSFDYENVHFVILNEYFDGGTGAGSDVGTDGDVVSELRTWLESDLQASTQPVKIVIGHEPAYPLPDEENGRLRHEDDSLNSHPGNRDLFWDLLSTKGVEAYLCGHTHNYSSTQFEVDGVWQIDVGHARGIFDTGARSTFVMFYVMADNTVWFYTYRLDLSSRLYELTEIGQL